MRKAKRVEVRRYRGIALEVLDDGRHGWAVTVYLGDADGGRVMLRDHRPEGLAALVKQAQAEIDRRLGALPAPDHA